MSETQSLPPPETVAAVRRLFFGRLAETNRDLIRAHLDLTILISQHDQNSSLGVLMDIDNRVKAMRNILMVLEECCEGSDINAQTE